MIEDSHAGPGDRSGYIVVSDRTYISMMLNYYV